jgi:hypothetical protein
MINLLGGDELVGVRGDDEAPGAGPGDFHGPGTVRCLVNPRVAGHSNNEAGLQAQTDAPQLALVE